MTTGFPFKPLALTIRDTGTMIGCKKSKIYGYLSAGTLQKAKLDGKTVVTMASIEKLIADAIVAGEQ